MVLLQFSGAINLSLATILNMLHVTFIIESFQNVISSSHILNNLYDFVYLADY